MAKRRKKKNVSTLNWQEYLNVLYPKKKKTKEFSMNFATDASQKEIAINMIVNIFQLNQFLNLALIVMTTTTTTMLASDCHT